MLAAPTPSKFSPYLQTKALTLFPPLYLSLFLSFSLSFSSPLSLNRKGFAPARKKISCQGSAKTNRANEFRAFRNNDGRSDDYRATHSLSHSLSLSLFLASERINGGQRQRRNGRRKSSKGRATRRLRVSIVCGAEDVWLWDMCE